MLDSFGREIDYLRISLTERCQARCVYCMPKDGALLTPDSALLSSDEVLCVTKIMAGLGIKKIKITGGEPLLRQDIHLIISRLKQIAGIERISITTNGFLLCENISMLIQAGISAINISIDSLDKERFKTITNTDMFDKVYAGLQAAIGQNIDLKVNCVPIAGLNNDDIIPLALLCKENKICVRFIELMPIGAARGFTGISHNETAAILKKEFGALIPCKEKAGAGPADYFCAAGFAGKIGFISALRRSFCASCNRLRLSSSGMLKPCLALDGGFDVKPLLREGANDEMLKSMIKKAIFAKPAVGNFSGGEPEAGVNQAMYKIGG